MTEQGLEDLDLPSRWPAWKPGLCEGCRAHCCSLPVEASPADLVRLGLLSAAEARGSLRKAARPLLASGAIREFNPISGTFFLGKKANGDCRYLDAETRRCGTYATRPQVCRQFPEVGPRPGHCPADRLGLAPTRPSR